MRDTPGTHPIPDGEFATLGQSQLLRFDQFSIEKTAWWPCIERLFLSSPRDETGSARTIPVAREVW